LLPFVLVALHIHVNVHCVLHPLLPTVWLGIQAKRSQEAKRANEKKRFLNHSEQLFIRDKIRWKPPRLQVGEFLFLFF
jgi:hypothetical protein